MHESDNATYLNGLEDNQNHMKDVRAYFRKCDPYHVGLLTFIINPCIKI